MARLFPKAVPENKWKQLTGNRAYAFRCSSEDFISFRLGMGKGFYLEVAPSQPSGRVLSSVEYDSAGTDLLYKLQGEASMTIGRADPATVKILHAYVSRQHIQMSLDGDILIVKDLGSINGSYYNADNFCFDIEKYIDSHPVKKSQDETLDEIHEIFGPTLDDFLTRYSQKKENSNDHSDTK